MSETSIETTEQQPATRAQDYRVLFANAFGLRVFGNGDAIILFGVDQDPAKPGSHIFEQVGIGTNIRALKLLSKMLHEAVSAQEEASGKEIEIDSEAVAAMKESIKRGKKKPSGETA